MADLGGILTSLKQAVVAINNISTNLSNGSNKFTALVQAPSFTVATVPAASAFVGGIIYVSNESGGAQPAFSDGSQWRRMSDRAVIT